MRSNLSLTLHLIRHGETDRNTINGDLIGQPSEEPMNKNGIDQSKKLAARLKKEGVVYDYLYSSPYLRAKETCTIIAEVMPKNMPIIFVPEIREIFQGEGYGKSRKEVYAQPGFKEKMEFLGSAFHFEGKGETLFDVEFRAFSWLDKEVLSNPFTRSDKPLTIGIITHGMTIKSLLHAVMQFDHRMTWKIKTDNASIAQLRLKDGQFYLDSINDISHLK